MTSYLDVQTVIRPEAPGHYSIEVRETDGTTHTHAVERVVVNTAEVHLADPVWFVGAKLDIGVPVDGHGEVVWAWV
jgi:hypothetical protein